MNAVRVLSHHYYSSDDSDLDADAGSLAETADLPSTATSSPNQTSTSVSSRHLTFYPNGPTLHVSESLNGAYGSHVWPSALVLAAYVHSQAASFRGKDVLELGCGTGVPGLLCGALGASNVLLTDVPTQGVLENLACSVNGNDLQDTCAVWPLVWGRLPVAFPDARRRFDWLLGADVFYDPALFEDLLATVAWILTRRSNEGARFVTTYQERSSRRSVEHILVRYGLRAKTVDKNAFGGWGEAWTAPGKEDDDGTIARTVGSVVCLVIEIDAAPG
ncbi:hypothetical protein HKX48_003927 [Thoreauomyces humboldtii]|nr:hypothetical protein HKX48_003927 [Thoreauomyces humboldtii]